MKKTKMSLANVQGKLTRSEMKNLTGGMALGESKCGSTCDGACTTNGLEGKCHQPSSGANAGKCFCTAVY